MGSQFSIKLVETNKGRAAHMTGKAIAEIQRLEAKLSEFLPGSEVSKININAGRNPVRLSEEVYQLLLQCQYISEITDGAFDITTAAAKNLYNFDRNSHRHPSQQLVDQRSQIISYKYLHLDKTNYAFLQKPDSKISLAAIGKGLAADKAKDLLLDEGIESGVINASGDIAAWGANLEGQPWWVGITNPDDNKQVLLKIPLRNRSISTSGNQYQFFTDDGIKYSHTLNPKTAKPLSGIKSVSIVHESATISDALATAVNVMGAEKGIRFVNAMRNTSCIIINDQNEVFSSRDIEIN
ncbi:MAG: FAD:protein FMN transferase [Cyclobacteriaceae bacterium]